MLECVITREIRGVVVVFNKVEVTSQEEVHVVGYAGQQAELLGTSAVVVFTCG